MKTELGFSSGSHAHRRSLSGTVLAAALCAGLVVAQNGVAQGINGMPAPGKGGASVEVYVDDKLVTPGALVVRLGEHFTIVEGHSYLTNVGLPRQYGISES